MSYAITKVQNANARRGGDVLLEVLESEGVEYVFGNPGTTELPFMDALLRKPSIQYVLALQEASAVAMADGYCYQRCKTDPPQRLKIDPGVNLLL